MPTCLTSLHHIAHGASNWIRTSDPGVISTVHYLLSYTCMLLKMNKNSEGKNCMTAKPSRICIVNQLLLSLTLSLNLSNLTIQLVNDRSIVILTTREFRYSVFNTMDLPIIRFLHLYNLLLKTYLAGMAGFEPASAGVKVPCLAAWLHPNITSTAYIYIIVHVFHFEKKNQTKLQKFFFLIL